MPAEKVNRIVPKPMDRNCGNFQLPRMRLLDSEEILHLLWTASFIIDVGSAR
jgi:hypothetical protein